MIDNIVEKYITEGDDLYFASLSGDWSSLTKKVFTGSLVPMRKKYKGEDMWLWKGKSSYDFEIYTSFNPQNGYSADLTDKRIAKGSLGRVYITGKDKAKVEKILSNFVE